MEARSRGSRGGRKGGASGTLRRLLRHGPHHPQSSSGNKCEHFLQLGQLDSRGLGGWGPCQQVTDLLQSGEPAGSSNSQVGLPLQGHLGHAQPPASPRTCSAEQPLGVLRSVASILTAFLLHVLQSCPLRAPRMGRLTHCPPSLSQPTQALLELTSTLRLPTFLPPAQQS